MQKAVELATEILKKSQIVQDTSSNRLKKDLQKNVNRIRKELLYYCRCKNIDIKDVITKAGDIVETV